MKRLSFVLAFFVGCAPSTSEQKSEFDTVHVVMGDTIAIDTIPPGTESELDFDPTAGLKDLKSNFSEPQLQADVAYVYRQAGLHVYESPEDGGDTTKAISLCPFGYKIKLTEPLVNNQPSDNITFEGFKGRYIAGQFPDGSVRYIFSGYLCNFPTPNKSEGPRDYFLRNFHLIEAPVSQAPDTEMRSWNATFKFESGIIMYDHGYYEGGGTEITLPINCTLQEGFLLIRCLSNYEVFSEYFPTYPTEAFTNKADEYFERKVETDKNGVYLIQLTDESGCIDATTAERVDGRIKISNDGGC